MGMPVKSTDCWLGALRVIGPKRVPSAGNEQLALKVMGKGPVTPAGLVSVCLTCNEPTGIAVSVLVNGAFTALFNGIVTATGEGVSQLNPAGGGGKVSFTRHCAPAGIPVMSAEVCVG